MFSRTTHCGFGVQPADVTLRCENICLGILSLTLTKCLLCARMHQHRLYGGITPVAREVLEAEARRK